MSDKKILVPEGMMNAACDDRHGISQRQILPILEAALRWLSENPIVPSEKQEREIYDRVMAQNSNSIPKPPAPWNWIKIGIIEGQRRMFLPPELEIPEAIKDIMPSDLEDPSVKMLYGLRILEAYRRGQKAGSK